MVVRVVLVSVAASLLAWLVILVRDDRLLTRGTEAGKEFALAEISAAWRGGPHSSPPGRAYERIVEDLRGARLLNPATDADVALARFQSGTHWERSVAELERVTRREPDNVEAWASLLIVTKDRDEGIAARALAALRRLDPLNFGYRRDSEDGPRRGEMRVRRSDGPPSE